MQIISVVGAAALLSTTALAVPELEARHNKGWRWSSQRHRHGNAVDPSTTDTSTSTTSFSDGIVLIQAVITSDWATIVPTTTAPFASINSTCPTNSVVTSYVTITANITSTSFLFSNATTMPDITSTTDSVLTLTPLVNTTTSGSDPVMTDLFNTTTLVSTTSTTSMPFANSTTITDGTVTTNAVGPGTAGSVPINSTTLTSLSGVVNTASSSTSSSDVTTLTSVSGVLNTASSSSTEFASTSFTRTRTRIRTRTQHHHRHSTTSTDSSSLSSSFSSSTSSLTSSSSTFTLTVLPISTASDTASLHPSTSIVPTATVSGTPPTGTANPAVLHCGLHGLPLGDYFLGSWAYQADDVPVTLLGCYKICASSFGIFNGCESYQFYPEEGTDAPRCDLYGGSVAQSLDSINRYVPNVWYDLGCGVPV